MLYASEIILCSGFLAQRYVCCIFSLMLKNLTAYPRNKNSCAHAVRNPPVAAPLCIKNIEYPNYCYFERLLSHMSPAVRLPRSRIFYPTLICCLLSKDDIHPWGVNKAKIIYTPMLSIKEE